MLAGSRRGGEPQPPPPRGWGAAHGAIAAVRPSHADALVWDLDAADARSDDPRSCDVRQPRFL